MSKSIKPEKRTFEKLLCANYNGKPYYEIQYINENGERHIGYSSYKLDYISDFLKEYFIPPAVDEPVVRCKDCGIGATERCK